MDVFIHWYVPFLLPVRDLGIIGVFPGCKNELRFGSLYSIGVGEEGGNRGFLQLQPRCDVRSH